VRIPAGAVGLKTACQGFMDRSLTALFTLPLDELDRFLRGSGFRPRAAGERRRLTREDRPKQVFRRLLVRIDGDRATVRLNAFET